MRTEYWEEVSERLDHRVSGSDLAQLSVCCSDLDMANPSNFCQTLEKFQKKFCGQKHIRLSFWGLFKFSKLQR